ncbi:MAG: GerMN domain-containing protein [Tepidanaerobacteraceae bacterium]
MKYARIILTAILCSTIIILAGCNSRPAEIEVSPDVSTERYISSIYDEGESQNRAIVYYYKEGFLIPTTLGIKETKQPLEAVLDLLFSSWAPTGFENKLGDVGLNNFTMAGDTITIDLAKGFTDSDVGLKKAQLLFTLAEFEDVGKINILVDGDLFETVTAKPKAINIIEKVENDGSIVIKQGEVSDEEGLSFVTVYFMDKQRKNMIPVTFNSEHIEKQVEKTGVVIGPAPEQKAKAALFHLIEGPTGINQLSGPIPKDVKLKDFYVKDGVAYVDVVKDIELIMNLSNEADIEKTVVESVVQTLTYVKEIDKVQFLFDGNKIGSIAGHTNISVPIRRLKWINPV